MPKGPNGQKRKADVIGNAVLVMKIATNLSLAVQMLALWLGSRGVAVRIIDEEEIDDLSLMRSVAADRPKYLLISMAVTDQLDGVAGIAKAAQALPQDLRPKIIVGGYPVKAGLISSIPAAELLSDISVLEIA